MHRCILAWASQALSENRPTMQAQALTITRPDDWHLHLRDGAALAAVLPATARQFARAIVMPNLRPPVTTAAVALAYRERITAALPVGLHFQPLMTLYLTDNTPPDEIRRAKEAGVVALKLYPAGATTNSDAGVTDLRKCRATLEAMQREGLLLLVHGEVTDPEVDIFDREAVFIDRVMQPLRRDLPELKVVFEHITTAEAAAYVAQADGPTAATITAHHLLFKPQRLVHGGLRPHYYCLPVLKKEQHRLALVQAATSGSPRFFLGTDSAPHAAALKEQSVCGAGCCRGHHTPGATGPTDTHPTRHSTRHSCEGHMARCTPPPPPTLPRRARTSCVRT